VKGRVAALKGMTLALWRGLTDTRAKPVMDDASVSLTDSGTLGDLRKAPAASGTSLPVCLPVLPSPALTTD
jgi:hypothetical protein